MNGALLHELDALVLHCDRMVHIIVKLHLQLVFQLAVFLQEVFVVDGIGEVFSVFCEQMDLAVVRPLVETIAHRVLCPNADILATSQEKQSMDFLVKRLPVEYMGQPG